MTCRNVPETSDEQKLNFLNWNLEIWVFFSRVMVKIVGQRINSFCPFLPRCTSLFSKTMCQVVVYRRFKTVENSQTVSRKSGHSRLRRWSFTRGFWVSVWGFDWEHFWCFGSVFKFLHSCHIHSLWKHMENISSITIICCMTYSKHLCQSLHCHLLFFSLVFLLFILK